MKQLSPAEKLCPACETVKPRAEFHRNRSKPDGLQAYCTTCRLPKLRQTWHKDPGKYEANRTRALAASPVAKAKRLLSIKQHSYLRRNAFGSFTYEEWAALLNLVDQKCPACGSDEPLTVDHIIPLSRGGSNFITNIQPLCASCNSSKNNRRFTNYLFYEWNLPLPVLSIGVVYSRTTPSFSIH